MMMMLLVVHCPNCNHRFIGRSRSRSRLYVRMFTHIRLKHWSQYQLLGKQLGADMDRLIG